jgi:hypothetical protein
MCSSRAYFLEQDMSAAAPSAVLPTYDGIVLAKVLSLDSDAACLRRKSMLRRKQHVHSTDDASFLAPAPIQANKKGEVVASQPKPVQQQQQQRQQQESPSPSPKVSPPPPAKEYNFFSNSSDDQDEQQHPQQSSPATNSGSTTNHSSPPPSSTPAPVLNRAALAEKRQHDIDDKVAAALAEKKDV